MSAFTARVFHGDDRFGPDTVSYRLLLPAGARRGPSFVPQGNHVGLPPVGARRLPPRSVEAVGASEG